MSPNQDRPRSSQASVEAAVQAILDTDSREVDPEIASRILADSELSEFLAQHNELQELGSWWRLATGQPEAKTVTLDLRAQGSSCQTELPAGKGMPDLPGYEILREIARGGMGVVYEACQTSLNRRVAVKLILQGALASDSDQQRFTAEAKAVAKLEHPNIVVIHEVGEHQGLPFFSMEYIQGESLARIAARGLLTPKQAAIYVRDIAHAIQFAHDHRVLHRDLKPSNVLVDGSGRVRVMDFGLAKHIDADDKLTVTGQLLGTPAYMAPEQVAGTSAVIGPACDVYGLGVILFELLTGQAPFGKASQLETLLEVLEADPPLLQQLNPHVPRQLELVALRCLQKSPRDRYQCAQDVAADLQRYLDGEPLSISSPNLFDRFVRLLQRSKFDQDVRVASRFVLHASWIALVTHAAIFWNYQLRSPYPLTGVVAIRVIELVLMFFAFLPNRHRWFPPKGAAARQLWSIWVGYLIGCQAIVAIDYLLAPPDQPYFSLTAYPYLAVLAGLVFVMLGSSYWGYCFSMGGAFIVLAIAMTLWLPAAPLLFGACWSISLALLGIRLIGLESIGNR